MRFVNLPTSGPFAESGGLVAFEAENYTSNAKGATPAANSVWNNVINTAPPPVTVSGGRYMQVPNANVDTGNSTLGPRLDYSIDLGSTDPYYVWIRGKSFNTDGNSSTVDDSVYVGLDGALIQPTTTYVSFPTTDWGWQQNTSASNRITFTPGSAGTHTLNLWMKRDGSAIDKIVITKDPNYVPAGLGPGESARKITPIVPPTFAPPTVPIAPRAADFSVLTDLSRGFDVNYHETSWNQSTDTLFADVTLKNNGRYIVRGDTAPLLIGVKKITAPFVTLGDPDLVGPDGTAYYDISRLAYTTSDTTLVNNDQVPGIQLKFKNPTGVQFNYEIVVLGAVNRAPAFTNIPTSQSIAINDPNHYSYQANAVDPDGDQVSYAKVAGPAWLSVSSSGLVSGTPPEAGAYHIVLRATDNFALQPLSTEAAYDLIVVDVPNRPPQFDSIPVVDAYVGDLYTYASHAFDVDGDALTYSIQSGNPGGDFQIVPGTGAISWQPTLNDLGQTFTVTLRATDPGLLFGEQTYSIVVHADPANRPPVITSDPQTRFEYTNTFNAPSGNVDPNQLALTLANGAQYTGDVSITLPGTVAPKVDVFLLFDDTGSFSGVAPSLVSSFPGVVSDLRTAFPAVDFGFGVGRFEDYVNYAYYDDRPFILNQPIIATGTQNFDQAIAAALCDTLQATAAIRPNHTWRRSTR